MDETNNEKKSTLPVSISKKEHARIEIQGELPWEELAAEEAKALESLGKDIVLPGFRKGKVPSKILREHLGDMKILYEMAERALTRHYPSILYENNIEAIGRPEIVITKIAYGNPLGFTITTSVMPTIELPDYRAIAKEVYGEKKEEDAKATEKELEGAIRHIREQWIKTEKYQELLKTEKPADIDLSTIEAKEDELPEITDEFVKKLGSFKDVDEFKTRLKENLEREKELREVERKRIKTLEMIREKSKIELPELLVENELDRMMAQFDAEVKRAGFKLDEYLKETGKTREELREGWRGDAFKRTEQQLILSTIARDEKISPEESRVSEEVEKIRSQYKDIHEERARAHVEMLVTNEMVFEFLEKEGNKKE